MKIQTLQQQNETLKKYFNIEVVLPKKLPEAHNEADGLFLIPKWEKIGKTYNEAVINVLEALKKDRPCYDYRGGNWSDKYLRQCSRFRNIPEIVSAQMGKKYKGKSVQWARDNMPETETPMGIYEIGIILLCNPEVLAKYEDLWIDCPGDEYSYVADGQFSWSPCFWFSGDGLGFGTSDVGFVDECYGSGSVFVPQVSLDSHPLDYFESLTLPNFIQELKTLLKKYEI